MKSLIISLSFEIRVRQLTVFVAPTFDCVHLVVVCCLVYSGYHRVRTACFGNYYPVDRMVVVVAGAFPAERHSFVVAAV